MHFDSRILLFWAASLFLFLLTMLVNSRLAGLSLYLILIGPMLIMPALKLQSPALILYCLITGLSIDALLPQNYWLFIFGLPFIGLIIRSIRGYFRTEASYRLVLLAHIANLACILLLSIYQGVHHGQIVASLPQIVAIITLSHTILFIVAPWFFSFERILFHLLNIEFAQDDELSEL